MFTVIALVAALVILIFFGVVFIRTWTFRSKQTPVATKVSNQFNLDEAVTRLGTALSIPTFSAVDPIDFTPFDKFRGFMKEAFPLVHSTLEMQVHNGYNLIYVWKGTDTAEKPVMLTGHYDVHTVTDAGWKYPPLSGRVAEDCIWGRGAIDDKSTVMGLMEAAEYLIKSGFKPTRTIYLAFGQDEENGGHQGTEKLAEYFKSLGQRFECVIDEGGPVTFGLYPGISKSQRTAMVWTGEKGMFTLQLSAQLPGGHSGFPPKQTSIGIIAAAIDKIEMNPFPAHWGTSFSDTFRYLGPEMTFGHKVMFANLWLFRPYIEKLFSSHPIHNATMRTTAAPDVFNAGQSPFSMPMLASALINFRLLEGCTEDMVLERVKFVINDPRVNIEKVDKYCWQGPPDASAETPSFQIINKSIRQVMPDVLVTPTLSPAGFDARYYSHAGLSSNIFRYSGYTCLAHEAAAMAHGVNERIKIESYREMIDVYIQLMRNFCDNV
jgi:carboxypeptidase PM20D1